MKLRLELSNGKTAVTAEDFASIENRQYPSWLFTDDGGCVAIRHVIQATPHTEGAYVVDVTDV